jgi:hypothetical protein
MMSWMILSSLSSMNFAILLCLEPFAGLGDRVRGCCLPLLVLDQSLIFSAVWVGGSGTGVDLADEVDEYLGEVAVIIA